jgi:3-methyladenine DNA glycosylase AlkD
MDRRQIVEWLESTGSPEGRDSLTRYGIPNDHAFGVPMHELKKRAALAGTSHQLAADLWETGWYEARTMAAFIDEPSEVTDAQMDRWAHDFDSWAICDTVCFHLFDKTRYAWSKVALWADAPEEFVRRASYALLWALSAHDKQADDGQFIAALRMLEQAEPDTRPLVKKAMDMALRATGKRNEVLRRAAIAVAERMAQAPDKDRAWIGAHSLRVLSK